jgi:2-octaprenyl-6-methoxyphenol hydroxylase
MSVNTPVSTGTTPPGEVDILIAGGGMVGASLASALARLPLKVALVEAVPFASEGQPSFDDRTVALSRSSQAILDTLGLWPSLASQVFPIRSIHVSERGRLGTSVINADEEGVPALGYVAASRILGATLWAGLAGRDNLDLHCPAKVVRVEPGAEAVRAWLAGPDGERELRARLLVVADGARSILRTQLGVEARFRPYGQSAIVGNVAVTDRRWPDRAFERFTPEGPLALLPAGPGRRAFILTRRTDEAPGVAALPEPEFLALLQDTFGFRLGRFSGLGRRQVYPLELVTAERLTGPRFVLVGNAAHSMHPVAGQGYNLGLRDVAFLAETVADHFRAGRSADPGGAEVLAAYLDRRRRDQRNVVSFTDGLIRLFGDGRPGMATARGLGLLAFDLVPGAKAFLARETMGLGGRLSRLARGLPL